MTVNVLLRHVLLSGLLVGNMPVALSADTTSDADASRENLHSVLWMQTSAEYRALALQAWQLAAERLHGASAPGSAALEQWSMPAQQLESLPTAVIVDLDETVLDNSYFQARLVQGHKNYNDADWDRWQAEESAPLIPGAREFLDEAARLGHRIFYVSNRQCPHVLPAAGDPCPAKTQTQRNLQALGLPGANNPDNLLLRRERPEWESNDKSARRAWIGQHYRIVAMAGDDLRDFVDRPVFEARREQLLPLFGQRWFILPNAMYGSWERSLVTGDCPSGSSPEECVRLSLEHKYALLQTQPSVPDLAALRHWDGSNDLLRLATWNIEYLLEPSTYAALKGSCVGDNSLIAGAVRQIPCDIVPRGERKPADFAALRRYATELDPDVIALEETDGPGAAAQIFPGHEFCFSSRPNVQKNGFAIRRGLPFRCEAEYLPISMDDAEGRGVVVTLFPGSDAEMTLLSVHLRSGCPEGPLTDDKNPRCARLAAQIPALKAWIDTQLRSGKRFAVLGDFNRRFTKERGAAHDAAGRVQNLWPEVAGDRSSRLVNIAAEAPFRKCIPGDEYDSYIDSIWIGPALAPRIIKGSFQHVTFSADDAAHLRLSDHCPVGIELRLH